MSSYLSVCVLLWKKRGHTLQKLFCQSGIYDYYICNVFSHLDKNSFNQPQYVFLIHHLSSGDNMFLFSELKTKYSEKEDDKTECVHVDVKEGIY